MRYYLLISLGLLAASCAPRTQNSAANTQIPRLPGMQEARYVEMGGEQVYYEVGGQGSPIVLIHGIGGGNSSHQWMNNTAALLKNHRVYALDIPGFGRSPAQAKKYTAQLYINSLEDFLQKVSGEGSAVIASSLPAAYSIEIAVRQPKLISKLLLVSPTGLGTLTRPPNDGQYNNFVNTPLGPLLGGTLRGRPGLNFFLYNQVYLDSSKITPAITSIYEKNLEGPNKPYPVYSFLSDQLNLDVRTIWPQVTQPVRMVWGSNDTFTPLSTLEEYRKLKDIPVDILKARAIPNDEQSEQFNTIALKFFK
jgi:pimeloyl-ACP methyl ester carboxylesterase